MSNFISFLGGTIFGAFMAQNYDIVNVKESYDTLVVYIQKLEKNERNK